MKLDKDPFLANMNLAELDGKKVLIRLSQAEVTKGKEAVIGEEQPLRMIKPKSLKDGQWQKNEGSKPQQHPKATFRILMAKYREGRVNIRGHKNRPSEIPNWTVRFPLAMPVPLQLGAHPANNLGLYRIKIQKVRIIVNKITTRRLTSRSGRQCLACGYFRR
jgi:hypothetical protein